jgi:2-octaprenyl-6-methoxyphenol hydroxylase
MVWVETTEDARDLHSLKPEQLRPLIEEKSRHRFGSVIAVEEGPHLFPLKSSHARLFASDRLLLAGDALRRIHPLAGQGLNLGLRDAAALARCVLDHARLGLDPGALEVSKEYAQLRQADSIFSSIFLDLFFDVFDIDGPGATLVRSAALRAADQLPILKNYLTSEAGGLRGAHSLLQRARAR